MVTYIYMYMKEGGGGECHLVDLQSVPASECMTCPLETSKEVALWTDALPSKKILPRLSPILGRHGKHGLTLITNAGRRGNYGLTH